MARRDEEGDGHRRPRPRPPLPERRAGEVNGGMTPAQLVEVLRATDGLVDVTGGSGDRPNFHLRHKPFLHFHTDPDSGGLYADVKFGGGAFMKNPPDGYHGKRKCSLFTKDGIVWETQCSRYV